MFSVYVQMVSSSRIRSVDRCDPITHVMRSRFPKLKIVVGHLGERIPSDLFRLDERRFFHQVILFTLTTWTILAPELARRVPQGMPMLRNVSSYWRTNLFETTSGNFATSLLQFHIGEIGLDRILYSVDYPFIAMTEGEAWVNSLPLDPEELSGLKRGLAIELLGLNK